MKILLNNYENDLVFENSFVNTIEILNKKSFYQMLKDFNNLYEQDNISFIENGELFNIQSKISIFYDYVNFDFDNKKVINAIMNLVNENIDEKSKDELNKNYNKIIDIYNKIIGDIDLKIAIHNEFFVEELSRLLKLKVVISDSLLDNLLLLIDIESEFRLNKLLLFVNLKDYLENSELEELYKYALYKEVNVLLIDNNHHVINNFEKKLFIDEDFIEFVI